jgi:hypothetical protein
MANQGLKNGYTYFKHSQIREFIAPKNRLKLLAPVQSQRI